MIPLVWLPVVCWLVSISTQRGLTPTEAALAVLGGVFIWTLLEYCLHRFLFHIKTSSYWWVLFLSKWATSYVCWTKAEKFCSGETPFTIYFMAAITSTLWTGYALFFPQLLQLFSVRRYINLFPTLYLSILLLLKPVFYTRFIWSLP